MKRQCPQCRKTMAFTVAKCQNCRMTFFEAPEPPPDLADICLRIAGAVLVAAIGAIVTIVLHPWS
jgi:hypothetical protein